MPSSPPKQPGQVFAYLKRRVVLESSTFPHIMTFSWWNSFTNSTQELIFLRCTLFGIITMPMDTFQDSRTKDHFGGETLSNLSHPSRVFPLLLFMMASQFCYGKISGMGTAFNMNSLRSSLLPETPMLLSKWFSTILIVKQLSSPHIQWSPSSILSSSIPDQRTPIVIGPCSMDVCLGNMGFSAAKAYKALIGHKCVHLAFKWIWKSKCQMNHKVFFWLLLKDRINTRDIL
jgi:hypothetical protein